MFVEETNRNEEQAGAPTDAIGEVAFGIELLDFHFALVGRGRNGMLDFEFGRHARAIVEAMSPAEDRACQIGLRLARVVDGSRVRDLAVAPERRRICPPPAS
jgi:hypothetical protein